MAIKTASFPATYSTSILISSTKQDEDSHKALVQYTSATSENKGYYSWNFTEIEYVYAALLQELGQSTVVGVDLNFSYNLSDDGVSLNILKHGVYFDADPEDTAADRILADTSVVVLGSVNLVGSTQNNVTVELSDLDGFFYDVQTRIGSRSHVTLALVRGTTTSAGSVEIGGTNLVIGGSDWRLATETELTAPPLLTVKYEVVEQINPTLKMKFTTQDPTTAQTAGQNSLGGFASSNDVFPSAEVADSISSTQTTIPIKTGSSLPTKTSGLASIGSEIVTYSGVDADRNLTGIVRGISPNSSFPAGFDSFGVPEKIHYLHTDSNNVEKLFDTRSSTGLTQYRCVAIANEDSSADFNIQDAFVGVIQNSDSNVQIAIGLEFPSHDSQAGTVDSTTSTSTFIDATFATYAAGFFNGDFIKIFNGTSSNMRGSTTISSFDGTGSFILTDAITGLNASDRFVIMPAPSQVIPNDATPPSAGSGRFTGFSETGVGIDVELVEHGNTMQENDSFYVWLRRTLNPNTTSSDKTGAILLFRFRS